MEAKTIKNPNSKSRNPRMALFKSHAFLSEKKNQMGRKNKSSVRFGRAATTSPSNMPEKRKMLKRFFVFAISNDSTKSSVKEMTNEGARRIPV